MLGLQQAGVDSKLSNWPNIHNYTAKASSYREDIITEKDLD